MLFVPFAIMLVTVGHYGRLVGYYGQENVHLVKITALHEAARMVPRCVLPMVREHYYDSGKQPQLPTYEPVAEWQSTGRELALSPEVDWGECGRPALDGQAGG